MIQKHPQQPLPPPPTLANERGIPSATQRVPTPLDRQSGDPGSSRAAGDMAGRTSITQFSEGVGMTPSSTSEDDGPQRLYVLSLDIQRVPADLDSLDQWLMANNTPVAGADAMINPYTSTGLPRLQSYNMPVSGYEQAQHFQPQLPDSGQYRFPPQAQNIGSFSIGLYHDPRAGTPLPSYGLGMSVGDEGAQSRVGAEGGEGNPTEFWDRLIDGIVGGQGYDLSGGPTL
jgi:hypothetical protein